MDFTSDLYSRDSHASNTTNDQGSDENSALLDNEEFREIKLIEEKEGLLSSRADLVEDLERGRRKLERLKDECRRLEDNAGSSNKIKVSPDNDMLLSLLVKDSTQVFPQHNVTSGPRTIDGGDTLQKELSLKYDALPLLNTHTRLDLLKKLYPNMVIQSICLDTDSLHTITILFREINFKLVFQMNIVRNCVESLKILHISNKVKLSLEPLCVYCENSNNVSFLLIGCSEYTRLYAKRELLFKDLVTAFHNYQPSRGIQSLKFVKNTTSVIIHHSIQFEKVPFARTQMQVELYNEYGLLENGHEIALGLIEEYGLTQGLKEFLRAVFAV